MKPAYFPFQLLLMFLFFAVSCANKKEISATPPGTDSIKKNTTPEKYRVVPGQYIVLIKDAIAEPAILHSRKDIKDRKQRYKESEPKRKENIKLIEEVITRSNIKKTSIKQMYADLLVGFSAKLKVEEVKVLKSSPHVKAVFEDREGKFEQDGFASQIFQANSFRPHHIPSNISIAGGPVDGSKKSTWIWIIDSGIDLDHPDLNVNKQYPFAKSFVGDYDSEPPEDTDGHGTMVAGIAAAIDNSFGTCGISSGAMVVPLKIDHPHPFLDLITFDLSDLLAALNHVASHYIPGDVVNLSLSGGSCSEPGETLFSTISNAMQLLGQSGVWMCIGSGNDGDCNGADRSLTACINGIRIFTVGEVNDTKGCEPNSNWGSSVDWAASGTATSTYLNGQYAFSNGTSFASPIVTGIIHARGGSPFNCGFAKCCETDYPIAHLSPLANTKFDVELELVQLIVSNVRDWDGTEDIFGKLSIIKAESLRRDISDERILWERPKDNPLHSRNAVININRKINLANNLSFDEVRNLKFSVGGQISDEEFGNIPKFFTCQECNVSFNGIGQRDFFILELPETLSSINRISADGFFHTLLFGNSRFFSLNFFENNRSADGTVRALFKLNLRGRPISNPTCLSCHAQGV
ncbi:MAG: S8 family serine peptidase [Ferruginibacter sp.]